MQTSFSVTSLGGSAPGDRVNTRWIVPRKWRKCKPVAHEPIAIVLATLPKSCYDLSMAKPTPGAADAGAIPERVSVTFDATKKQRFFANSDTAASIKQRQHTEHDLLAEALSLMPGMTIETLVKQGSLTHARDIVRRATLRGNPTRLGAADKRLAAAYAKRLAENASRTRRKQSPLSITASTLARDARTNLQTAERWLTGMGLKPFMPQPFRARKSNRSSD